MTLGQRNLGRGKIDRDYDPEIPEGCVISHYPTEGAKVAEGTDVNLVISRGPDPKTQTPDPPTTTDPGTNPGTGTETDPGTTHEPSPVTRTARISLSAYEGEVDVRVLMDGVQIYSSTVDATMTTAVDVPVHGTVGMGTKELAVYINGVASGTVTVNFDS